MIPTNDATSRSDESEVPMKRIGVPIPCISKPNCEHIEVQRRDFKPIEKIRWVSKDRKALDDSARGCMVVIQISVGYIARSFQVQGFEASFALCAAVVLK
jgi:hypothetical protein